MTPIQIKAPYDWVKILKLVQKNFAYMEPRIDPPSSMYKMTIDNIADHAKNNEIWAIASGSDPIACIFLTPKNDRMYMGKLAVEKGQRKQGIGRLLVAKAEERTKAFGFSILELETRVELLENHTAFTQLGFVKTGESAHAGYNLPTSITMQKAVL